MSRRKIGLVAAMEEYEAPAGETLPVNDTQPTVDPEVGEPQADQPETVELDFPATSDGKVEEQEIVVRDAEDAVVAVEEQIENGIEVIEQVERIADIVDRGAENGGLNETGAELLAVNLEHLYESVGIVGGQYVPSLEHFGGVSSRIRNTQVSVEDMREKIKTIAENVMKAIMAMIKKVGELAKQLMEKAERLKQRIERIRGVKDKLPKAPRVSSIENAAVAGALAIGNKVTTDIRGSVNALNTFGAGFVEGIEALAGGMGKGTLDMMNDPKFQDFTNQDDAKGAIQASTDAAAAKSWDDTKSQIPNLKDVNDEERTARSETLIGNVYYSINLKQWNKPVIDMNREQAEVSATLPVLDAGQIDSYLKAIDALFVSEQTIRSTISKNNSTNDKLVKDAVNSAKNSKSAFASTALTGLAESVKVSIRSAADIERHIHRTAQAMTVYMEESVRAHAAEKEPAAEPAAA